MISLIQFDDGSQNCSLEWWKKIQKEYISKIKKIVFENKKIICENKEIIRKNKMINRINNMYKK